MWAALLPIIDKVLGIFDKLFGWLIQRSDEKKKKRDAAQAEMQEAVKKGDYDAYWAARSKRNRA